GGALNATVPASIVVRAVPVILAVGFIVLLVVRDQVIEREAVVTGHEVHALFSLTLFVAVDLRAAKQAVGKTAHRSLLSAEEAPHIIAEASIPFFPTIANEAADLVQTRGIPGFGNQLGSGKGRIRLDIPKNRRIGHHGTVGVARENGCQIEPEAIHV